LIAANVHRSCHGRSISIRQGIEAIREGGRLRRGRKRVEPISKGSRRVALRWEAGTLKVALRGSQAGQQAAGRVAVGIGIEEVIKQAHLFYLNRT
jgi:hypothetical protein